MIGKGDEFHLVIAGGGDRDDPIPTRYVDAVAARREWDQP